MNERGQFFLLAAVIISAVIIGLGVGTNMVLVNDGPGDFYDFSYEVKREVGALLDYEIYSNFDDGTNLTEFVDLLAREIEERSPGSDFIFIYGNGSSRSDWEVRNYGSESIYADGVEIDGVNSEIISRICLQEFCQNIDENLVDFDHPSAISTFSHGEGVDEFLIEIEGNAFIFPLSDYRQVIFIMQKNVGGDRHVIVE